MDSVRAIFAQQDEIDAKTRQENRRQVGADAVCDCVVGNEVSVKGVIAVLRIHPQANAPVVEAELWDGSGRLALIWQGRREIPGINAGREIHVKGKVALSPTGGFALYNPIYELFASH
jgi:hypothetical protein